MSRSPIFSLFRLVLAITVIVLATGCQRDRATTVGGVIWGTTYRVTVVGQGDETSVSQTVTAILDSLDGSVNAFNRGSEIAAFNDKGEVTPSVDFMNVLREAIAVNRLTDGAFDPTVGPLVDFWGFGAGEAGNPVDSAGLARARAAVGLDKIAVADGQVTKSRTETRLDFGAIAKGYAVDRVFDGLSSIGTTGVMVEIGGEVRVGGVNAEGEQWKIQIDAPVRDRSGNHVRLGILSLDNAAVATSGNYRNYRELPDGRIVAHTIDPTTGTPVESDVLSATVIASTTMRADAFATAVMVMGRERGAELLRRLAADPASGIYGAILVTATATETIGLPSPRATFVQP